MYEITPKNLMQWNGILEMEISLTNPTFLAKKSYFPQTKISERWT